jgi:hypothetical protein
MKFIFGLILSIALVNSATAAEIKPAKRKPAQATGSCTDVAKAFAAKFKSDKKFAAKVSSLANEAVGSNGAVDDMSVDCGSVNTIAMQSQSGYKSNTTDYMGILQVTYSPKDLQLVIGSVSVIALFRQDCQNGGPDGDLPTGCEEPRFLNFIKTTNLK